MGEGYSTLCPGCIIPRKGPVYLSYRRLDRPNGRPGRMWPRENYFPPPGLKTWTIQSVVSRYTNYTIMALQQWFISAINEHINQLDMKTLNNAYDLYVPQIGVYLCNLFNKLTITNVQCILVNSTLFFMFMWPCIVTNFFIIKPTYALM